MVEQRRLTTVLFADIVGYTSLMQADETRAMLFLGEFKDLVGRIVPLKRGEIIQYYGDAVLLTFDSAVAGVECAVEFQHACTRKGIPIRIGMHLGDVIFKNDNVFGNGVNIASRIESMGIPGCVLISKAVRDQLVSQKDYVLKSLGSFEFKNVTEPMEVFAIGNDGLAVPVRGQLAGKLKVLERPSSNKWRAIAFFPIAWMLVEAFSFFIAKFRLDPVILDLFILMVIFGICAMFIRSFFKGRFNKFAVGLQLLNGIALIAILLFFLSHPLALNPGKLRLVKLWPDKSSPLESLNSLAVLPFSNNLGDGTQDYLVAGMHLGMISEIGQLGSMRVISSTSSLPYQNTNKNIRTIADELNVDAIIEASVTRVDTAIELRINLIKAFPDEEVLWNHSYWTSVRELPNLYKEVTKNVALKINKVLRPEEALKLTPKRIPNAGAYEACLHGWHYTGLLTREGLELAEAQFRKAIEIDSLFAPGYNGLAGILSSAKQMGYVSGVDVNPILDSLMEKAYELDSLDASVELGYAAHLTWREFKWDEAEIHFKRSIEINPNASVSHAAYAHYLMIRNRWDDAWEQMDYAIELDPQNPWVVAFSAAVFYHDGKLLSAAKNSERLIRIAPNHPMANEMLLGKYIFQKKYDEAIIELKKYVGRTNAPRLNAVIDEAYQDKNFDKSIRSTAAYLEKYSVDHFVSPEIIHTLYQFIDDDEKQLDWMMKMYEVGDGNLPYCAVRNDDPIQQDPTYQLIMKEIGLW